MVAADLTDDWDPRDPEVLEDQLRAYDRRRTGCPVAHSDYLGWSIFRHEDVVAIAEDATTYSSAVSVAHPAVPNGYDPPQHDTYRQIVDHYFSPEQMARFEPLCRVVAMELTETLPRNEEVEFISHFALTYALRAQRAWLGWPHYTEAALRDWTAKNHRATLARDREAMDEVATGFDGTVRRVIADRRAQPVDVDSDITSQLLLERIDGVPLRDDEIVSILRNWTVGELGTISASVGILIDYLARHPDLQDRLRRSAQELPSAIDEILRIHTPLLANRRVTTRAVELGGRRIAAGERVTVFWASANRDEAVFGDPDEYQPERNAPRTVLYGRGIHACPGAPLSRLELQVVLEALLSSTNQIEANPNLPPDYAAFPASGFRTLPVRIT